MPERTAGLPRELEDVLARAQRLGLLGESPVGSHIEHALAHGRAAGLGRLPVGSRVLDLGSGGGVPGLVVACRYSELGVSLLDRSAKRCAFLREAVEELQLADRVEVAEGDATDLAHSSHHRAQYTAVLSRAFGPPAATAECAAGYLAAGGQLVVSEPPAAQGDRWPDVAVAELGFGPSETVDGPPRFALLKLEHPPPTIAPRPWKQVLKRPLF